MPSKSDPIPPMSEEVKQFIRALNRLVVIYTTYPELPVPYYQNFNVFVNDRLAMAKVAKQLARWRPKKDADDNYYALEVELSAHNKIGFNIARKEVCERVQIGTKLVEVPAKPAVEAHVEEQPQYEWKCPGSLLGEGA